MKIAIIGGGPIGLYFASLCQKNQIDYTLFEAAEELGGQVTQLYPKKIVTNIPGFDAIVAEDYIKGLVSQIDLDKVKLGSKITHITDSGPHDYIINATGRGEFIPRKLTNFSDHFEQDVCNIRYSLKNYDFLAGQNVVIFGGGDSALDWAKQLSEICQVALVHRRTEFRGNAETISGCDLAVLKPYIYTGIDVSKFQKTVRVSKVGELDTYIDIPYDYIFVNFGCDLRPVNFEDESCIIYKVGDCAGTTTIAAGIAQADQIFEEIING